MKAYPFPGAILLFFVTSIGSGFEPYDYQKVPFPETREDLEFKLMSLVETLTDIASIEEVPDQNKARILAAARRISPLNRSAFFTEYELSIGQKPSGGSPIRKEMITSFLQPHLAKLSEIPGTEPYIKFLSEAVDLTAFPLNPEKIIPVVPYSPPAPFAEAPLPTVKATPEDNACGLLTMEGCVSLESHSNFIPGPNFQFSPGNLKSGIFLSAYRESLKFLALTSTDGLAGKRLSFLIDTELTAAEGPAAALACAVLTEALARNFKIDSRVAFAGDVNADGTVQPLNDLGERLLASPDSLYDIIVIPKADQYAADDILLLNGPWMFSERQLIGVNTLGETMKIAKAENDPEVKEALKIFQNVQQVLNQPEGRKFLKNSHVRKRLDKILKLMPNHISARQLNLASRGQSPASLSLTGSFDLIFKALKPVINDGEIDQDAKLDPDAMDQLKRYRERLDPTLKNLVDATFTFETSGRIGADSGNERARVKQKLKEELNAISRNVKIREKMM